MTLSYIGLHSFLRTTAGAAKRVLAIVILPVRLSVRRDPVPIQAQVRRRLWFSPYDSLEYLVS